MKRTIEELTQYSKRNWPWLLAAGFLIRFAYKVIAISISFPNLFRLAELLAPSRPLFILPLYITLAAAVWRLVIRQPRQRNFLIKRLGEFARANWPGFMIAIIFFAIYIVLAAVFNRSDFNNNNVFFAADTHQWKLRLADPGGSAMEMRAVHPLAFLLLRPLAFAVSLATGADFFNSVIFLLAVIGGLSVFLIWAFIQDTVGSVNHTFLFASIFGISTAELMFNTITETYIFSGFLLALFFVLLQKGAGFFWLMLTGVGVFGITISNLVQVLIGAFLSDLRLRRTLLIAVTVVLASAGLSLVNKAIYLSSGLFFNPPDYAVESLHYFEARENYSWAQRAKLVASDIFLFSVIAPQPYLQNHNKDERGEFPKFNFMQGVRLSQFVGTGRIAIWVWLGILGLSITLLGTSLKQQGLSILNRLTLAFLVCLAFNFAFHLFYGFEPFLYSANWTYALVLFVALCLRSLAYNKWLQITLLILLALLTLNNLSFLYSLMNGISPYILGQ
ncbi:MAG: hypothetical protein ACRDFQ_06385 [Anaerolineales bacterium]